MSTCARCETQSPHTAALCEFCGEPLTTEREADDMVAAMLLQQARKVVWFLGLVAVIHIGWAMSLYPMNPWVTGAAVFFTGLAVVAMRVPLLASQIALTLFCGVNVAYAVIDPETLARNVVIKTIVVFLLLGAIERGLKHRAFQDQRTT